jgi:hypothetical protein
MAPCAAHTRIQQLYKHGVISPLAWQQLAPELERQVETALAA